MADDHDSSGGAPSTDDMLNALASEVSGKKAQSGDEGATTVQETVTPEAEAADEPEPVEAAAEEPEPEPEPEAVEEPAAPSKKSAPRSSTSEIKDAAAIFGISQADLSLDDIDFDEAVDDDDDMLGAPAGGGADDRHRHRPRHPRRDHGLFGDAGPEANV